MTSPPDAPRRPDWGIALVIVLIVAVLGLAFVVVSLWENGSSTETRERSREQEFEVRELETRVRELEVELRAMQQAAQSELEPAMRAQWAKDVRAKQAELAAAESAAFDARRR